MNHLKLCPACGAALPESRLDGLCPACAWKGMCDSDETETPLQIHTGSIPLMRLPGYEILEEIARGGMGIVYRARQLDPPRTVALKMLLPHQLSSANMTERFRLEVRALTELEHPAILPVYEMGQHDGLPFFTMKLAAGGPLTHFKEQLAGDWRAIAQLMVALADAVQFAHDHGVLHRDLKPGNVVFDEQQRPYITDFGLAKLVSAESDLTRSADFLGTPHYVAPEVASHSARAATTASDVYSLGAILYELLTGRPPFEAESVAALLKKINDEEPIRPSVIIKSGVKSEIRGPSSEGNPKSEIRTGRGDPKSKQQTDDVNRTRSFRHSAFGLPSDLGSRTSDFSIPRDLEVICLKCLEKEPHRRYARAGDLADDLRRWLARKPILARPVSKAERSWKWVRRNPVLASLAAALAMSFLASGLLLWRANLRLRAALNATRAAQQQAQDHLRQALLDQSRALGSAGATGQRWIALEGLGRAARIKPSLELRNEATAALARPDLRELNRFAAIIGEAGSSIVFTSDLESFIAPELDGGFALRSTRDQKIQVNFNSGQHKPARWFVLSPDDRYVAALTDDYQLEIWRLDSAAGPLLRFRGSLQQPPVAEFHPTRPVVAVFTPREGLFVQNFNGTERMSLQTTNGRVVYLRFAPAGERLAVVRDPGGVELWQTSESPRLLWFEPMVPTVPWLAWSPDGQKLLVAANDGRGVRILSAANGQTQLLYSRHLLYPRQFEFSPDGRIIASLGQDWALRLWDALTGQDLVTGVGRHRVMRFSHDGRRLATALTDTDLAVLELAPERVFHEFAGRRTSAEVVPFWLKRSADNRFLLASYPDLRVYDTRLCQEMLFSGLPPNASRQAFIDPIGGAVLYSQIGQGIYRLPFGCSTNQGKALEWSWNEPQAVSTETNLALINILETARTWVVQKSNTLELWPNGKSTEARRLPIHPPPQKLAVSKNGRWAAVADGIHAITIWTFDTGGALTNLAAPGPDHLWFSPDNRWLVASTRDGYAAWETGTWKPTVSWDAHLDSGDPGELAFSDDSHLVIARHQREAFRLLTFPDAHELVTLKPPLVLPGCGACLSGDGTRLWLLAAGCRVFEWDLLALRQQLDKIGLNWPEHP